MRTPARLVGCFAWSPDKVGVDVAGAGSSTWRGVRHSSDWGQPRVRRACGCHDRRICNRIDKVIVSETADTTFYDSRYRRPCTSPGGGRCLGKEPPARFAGPAYDDMALILDAMDAAATNCSVTTPRSMSASIGRLRCGPLSGPKRADDGPLVHTLFRSAARRCPVLSGVWSAGDRRRAAEGPRRHDRDRTQPELRHITVVFCDLVGSTELSSSLDRRGVRRTHPGLPAAGGGHRPGLRR